MDEPATTATCAPSPAVVHTMPPPSQPVQTQADATSVQTPVPVTVAAASSSAARRPPLGTRRVTTSRPRGIAQPRRPPTTTAATTDDSDDAGSEEASTRRSRDCPTRAQALQEFLACVAAEITELVAAFQTQPCEVRCFSSFKALWMERRLSALFQVEFWDSTPSDTHHAVLQIALELLEDAVQTATAEDDTSVWALVGFWFALYCAYCVQLSEPKIKIAVDLVAWQSVTQLTGLLTRQLTKPQYSGASCEALAMMRRLEHEDGAFLKCLGGSVADFRLKPRARRQAIAGTGSDMPTLALLLPPQRKEELEDMVTRLEALSTQYNSALNQLAQVETSVTDATEPSATPTNTGGRGGGGGRGRGRGRAMPTFLRKIRPNEPSSSATSGSGSSFLQEAGLWGEQKATEHGLWVAQVRQSLFPSVYDGDQRNAGDESVRRVQTSEALLFVDDDGATDDVDAALLALEQELEREEVGVVSTQSTKPPVSRKVAPPVRSRRAPAAHRTQNDPKSDPRPTAIATRPARASAVVSSGQESDGLDELEAELARDVAINKSSRQSAPATSNKAALSARAPPVARSRPRAPSMLSLDTESDGLADLEAELERDTMSNKGKRARRSKAQVDVPASRSIMMPRATRSRAISVASTAEESDGLEELEAELTRETRRLPQRGSIQVQHALVPAVNTLPTRLPLMTRSRAVSIGSTGEETDGLEELEAELARGTHGTASIPHVATSTNPTAAAPQAAVQARKRAFSIASSGQESDGLAELEAELGQSPPQRATTPLTRRFLNRKPPQQQPAKGGPQQPLAFPATRPPRAQPRHSSRFSDVSSVDEMNLLQQELDASLAAAPAKTPVPRPPAPSRKRPAQTPSTSTPSAKRRAVTASHETRNVTAAPVNALPPRRSRRLSDVSSVMTESDTELAALQAELTRMPQVEIVETATALPTEATIARVEKSSHERLRSMSELSETTESDEELKELQAELAKTTTAKVVVEPVKKPRAKANTKASRDAVSQPKEPRRRAAATAVKAKRVAADGESAQGVKAPRKPRQSKATAAKAQLSKAAEVASIEKPPLTSAPQAASRATRLSSRRSIASSYDSDGLDELEMELRAFQ